MSTTVAFTLVPETPLAWYYSAPSCCQVSWRYTGICNGPRSIAADPSRGSGCPHLADDYEPVGQVVHADGSPGEPSVIDQFLREEIIGTARVNQEKKPGTRLTVIDRQPSTFFDLPIVKGCKRVELWL